MDDVEDGIVIGDGLNGTLGDASQTSTAKLGQAIDITNGGMTLGMHDASCLGNMNYCNSHCSGFSGIAISMWVLITQENAWITPFDNCGGIVLWLYMSGTTITVHLYCLIPGDSERITYIIILTAADPNGWNEYTASCSTLKEVNFKFNGKEYTGTETTGGYTQATGELHIGEPCTITNVPHVKAFIVDELYIWYTL